MGIGIGSFENGGREMMRPYVPSDRGERCTANTDKVDREIKNLKEQKKQLERQIKSCKDFRKVQDLEKELAGVESELLQKDNDAYRKQNTRFTE